MRIARDALTKATEDANLQSKKQSAEVSLAAAEAWAKACEECEAAVRRGREALAADSRDEAAGYCRTARGLIDGGLKSEALRAAVKELEQQLSSGRKNSETTIL
jgi:hypothetical protein